MRKGRLSAVLLHPVHANDVRQAPVIAGNREAVLGMVRAAFRRNQHETDPEKIVERKMDAVRGLGNYALMEAARLQKERAGPAMQRAREEAARTNFDARES